MSEYKLKPNLIVEGSIEKKHLKSDAYKWVTTDGVKFLGGSENNSVFTSVYAIVSKLKDMHGSDLTNNTIKSHLGHFVAFIVLGDTKISFFDILNNCTNPDPNNEIWIQSITGNLTLNNGKLEYSSDNIGTFVRKYIGDSWSVWKISNNTEITDNNSEIIKRLQGTSENNQYKDPFKTINHTPQNIIHVLNGKTEDAYGNKINLTLDDLTPYIANNISYNTGNYRSYSGSGTSFLDLKIYAIDWKNKKYMQSVFGPITCVPSTGELKWVNDLEFGEFYRISNKVKDSQGNDVVVWGKWNPVNKKEIEYIIQGEDDSSKAYNRPFKLLKNPNNVKHLFYDINDGNLWKMIDELHTHETTTEGAIEGTWRFYIGYMPIDVKVIARHYISDMWHQSFESFYECEDYTDIDDNGNKVDKQRFKLNVNNIKPRKYYRNRINPDGSVGTQENPDGIITNNYWTKWVEVTDDLSTAISNEATRARQAETELINRLQGKSDKSDSRLDGFKWIGDFNDGTGFTKAYELFNNALDSLTYDSTNIGHNYGYFRANVGNHRQLEIRNLLISSSRNYIIQVVSGCFAIIDNKIAESVDVYTIAARIYRNEVWEEWKVICDSNTMININNNITAITNEKIRAEQAETELISRLQGTSKKTDPKTDPFKFIGDFNNIEGLITELDKMRESGKGYYGVFRARLFGLQPIIIINTPVSASTGVWNQMLMGCVDIKSDGTLKAQGYIYSVVYRISSSNGWGKWQLAGEERIKEILSNDLGNVREELEKRITCTSDVTSPWKDSFKKIQDFTDLPSLDEYLKGWHGESIEDYDNNNDGKIDASATKGFVGKFRTNVAGIPIEIFSSVVGYGDKTDNMGDTSVWVQEIKGAIDIDHGGRIQLDNNKFKSFYEDIEVENGATKACVRKYKNVLRFVGRTNNTGGINTLRRIFDGSIGGWGDWINVSNPYITSPLYGKNVLVLGGSFAHNTRAYTNSGNTGYGFDEQGRQYALQNYIAKSLGLKRFDNFALAGKGVCIDKFKSNDGKDLSIYGQLNRAIEWSNLENKEEKKEKYVYDAIIIMGGINDFGAHAPLGKITDPMGNNTFYGSYKKIVDAARKYNKDVKLYMTTPFKAFNNYNVGDKSYPDVYWQPQSIITNNVGLRYQDYVQALKVISQYKSIPLLDIFSIQQVDTTNYNYYYRVDDKTSDKVNGDAAHPNGKGYKMIASALIDFLAWGKGMETFDFDVLSYKNTANIKANSDSIIAEVNRATIAENDIKNDIIVKIQNVKNEILSDTNDELSELLKRIQGNSTDSISFDPFIKLSWEPRNKKNEKDTEPDINDYMNNLCPKVVNKDDGTVEYDYKNKTGHFRAYSNNGTSCLDIKVDVLSWASDDGKIKERFVQTVSGPVTLKDNKLYWVNGVPVSGPGYYYRLSERAKNEELKWLDWKPVNNSYIESLQNQVNSLQQQIESILNTINTISIK